MARREHRLALRARVTLGFAFGALILSITTAVLAYQLARNYLLDNREESAVGQAYGHANFLRGALFDAPDIPQLLASVEARPESHSVLHHRGVWFASSLLLGRDALPGELRSQVLSGNPARQRFDFGGVPRLAVGVPLPAVDGAYFEVTSLKPLEQTLQVLRTSLSVAAVLTALAGAALGRWASRRVLQPLSVVAQAAAALSHGSFDVRLDARGDTDLAVLADSFNHMTDALRERIRRDARFASAVSHELRSPLTTLVTSLEVLSSRRQEMSDRAGSAVDLLASEVRRFQRLVQDLLEISRVDAGAVEQPTEEIRIGELVRHAVIASTVANPPVEVDADAEEVVVLADKRRLERVIANLVENAEQHGNGAVRVAVQRNNDRVRIAVEDAGPGVPEDDRERIFERFGRGRAAGRRSSGEGTGLGLALVAEHVRVHAGNVWVEERRGGGARFVVELPVASR